MELLLDLTSLFRTREDSTGLDTAGGDAHFHEVGDKGNACVRWNGAGFYMTVVDRVGGSSAPHCKPTASGRLFKSN